MLLFVGILLRVLAFGTQVAPAYGLKFNFTDVQQCDPIIISFAGTNTTTRNPPKSLSILPAFGLGISVPLPDPSVLSTGISVTFLPFAAGTNFLASLDDENGKNVIAVSDVLRVLPSPNGNSTCIPQATNAAQRNFRLLSGLSQCKNVSLSYNTSVVSQAPNLRLYQPKGGSVLLNVTSDDRASGVATYMLSYFRGQQVLVLGEDTEGLNIRETSPLLTVQGDAASDTSCLDVFKHVNNSTSSSGSDNAKNAQSNAHTASRAIIIGSAAGGGTLLFIVLCMVVFVMRDRQRRRKGQDIFFYPSLMEKPPGTGERLIPNQAQFAGQASTPAGMVFNPVYTSNAFQSRPSKVAHAKGGSMASWAQVVPDDQRTPASQQASPTTSTRREITVMPPPPRSPDNASMQSLDIEGMLNLATLQTQHSSSRDTSVSTIGRPGELPQGSEGVASPGQTHLRPDLRGRHWRDPSDVPGGPDSMSFSGYSVNAYPNARGSAATSLLDSPYAREFVGGRVVLPSSPLNTNGGNRQSRMKSEFSSRSSSDWYGFAR